jgi:hypothetical protein
MNQHKSFAQTTEERTDLTDLQKDMILAGGKEWTSGAKHRIYFNDLHTWYGLTGETYNTGNISYAELDGEKISNSRARKIISELSLCKVWYDFDDSKYHASGFRDIAFMDVITPIKDAVAELQAQRSTKPAASLT